MVTEPEPEPERRFRRRTHCEGGCTGTLGIQPCGRRCQEL